MRSDNRTAGQLRPIKITRHFTEYAEGSVLIECGKTKVICTATIEENVPRWLKGRTVEIQRLIGRALRAVVDLKALGERSITVDCDVIQADGGTRTASITGAFVALVDAIDYTFGGFGKFPITDFCAAISVGIGPEGPITDLCYEEDSAAVVDMNVVRTGAGNLIEVQGTGEHGTFSRDELNQLLDLAESATDELMAVQRNVLGSVADKIGKVYPDAPVQTAEGEQ